MIVYNITTKVHYSIDDAWLQWQRSELIPAVMATGFFTSYKMFRLLEQDDEEGKTYAVQYFIDSRQHYDLYMNEYDELFRKKNFEKWGDRTIAFRSLLEVMQ